MKGPQFKAIAAALACMTIAFTGIARAEEVQGWQLKSEKPRGSVPLARGYVEKRRVGAPAPAPATAKPGPLALKAEKEFEEEEEQGEDEEKNARELLRRWNDRPEFGAYSNSIDRWNQVPGEPPYYSNGLDFTLGWTSIGVGGIAAGSDKRYHKSGRATEMMLAYDHVTGANSTFVSTSSGGLYKSVIVGIFVFFVPIGDNLPGSPSVGAFMVNKANSNKILVGTGDLFRYGGSGVYRTLDQGQTWTKLTLPIITPSVCFRMVADSTDPTGNRVVLASDTGIYRTTDFGTTWTRVSSVNATDLVQDVTFPTYWYAGASGNGMFLSVNNALSFANSSSGITTPIGRVAIDYCQSNPNYVYLLAESSGGGFNGIYRSTNYGTNWTKIQNVDEISGGQGFHTGAIAVKPTDPNIVFAGMAGMTRSSNATAATPTWTGVDAGHADETFIQFSASDSNRVWFCNDGGLYSYNLTTNTPDGTYNILGLRNLQSYALEGSKLDETKLMSGLQDNGQMILDTDAATPLRSTLWGGDGGPGSFSSANVNHIAYSAGAAYQRLLTTDGTTFNVITAPLPTDWAPSMLFDPVAVSASTLYTNSGQYIYFRNVNSATPTWDKLSTTPLPNNPNGTPFNSRWVDAVAGGTYGWYVMGWDTGKMYYGTGSPGFVTWAERTPPIPSGSTLLSGGVYADRYLADVVYYTGAYSTTGGTKFYLAFRSSNRGQTWTNVTGNLATILPGAAFQQLISDPDFPTQIMFLTTTLGVLRTDDGGVTWYKYMSGLPLVTDSNQIVLTRKADGTKWLRLSTYGRSYWERKIEYYSTRTLALRILLQQCAKISVPAEVLIVPDNTEAFEVHTYPILADNDSTVNFNLPNTTYKVWVKSRTHLSKVISVNLIGGNYAPTVSLLNGDVTEDNYVGTNDYLRINNAFDRFYGDAGYDFNADLNGDSYVGTDDYLILNANFDLTGDEL